MGQQGSHDENKQTENAAKGGEIVSPSLGLPHSVYNMMNVPSMPLRERDLWALSDKPVLSADAASTDPVTYIISSINGHRYELEDIGIKLAKIAQTYTKVSLITKVLVILLGAFIATREIANQILGTSNTINIVIYAAVGLIIATLTGLEAAFRWESRSAELRTLVTTCRTTARKISANLTKILAKKTSQSNQTEEELTALLDSLDSTLADIQTKASSLGIDTTKYRDSTD